MASAISDALVWPDSDSDNDVSVSTPLLASPLGSLSTASASVCCQFSQSRLPPVPSFATSSDEQACLSLTPAEPIAEPMLEPAEPIAEPMLEPIAEAIAEPSPPVLSVGGVVHESDEHPEPPIKIRRVLPPVPSFATNRSSMSPLVPEPPIKIRRPRSAFDGATFEDIRMACVRQFVREVPTDRTGCISWKHLLQDSSCYTDGGLVKFLVGKIRELAPQRGKIYIGLTHNPEFRWTVEGWGHCRTYKSMSVLLQGTPEEIRCAETQTVEAIYAGEGGADLRYRIVNNQFTPQGALQPDKNGRTYLYVCWGR
jgi:hypothetical protein